jgi:hypothetical protein
MFASRKIVNIQTASHSEEFFVKPFVRPSMENKPARPLWILFSDNQPQKAFCQCPSGKSGLCCHVSAVLYALEEYHRTGNLSLEVACTSKLQTWHKNKPWQGKLTEIDNIKVQSAHKKLKSPQQTESRPVLKKVQQSMSTHASDACNRQREL